MPIGERGPAPYAPTSTVMEFIRFYRDRGVTPPIDVEKLERIGINASLSHRTMRSLELLDLIDKEGQPTDMLRRIKEAPSDKFQTVLATWFTNVYQPVLSFIEPTASMSKIIDQFRVYEPHGMRPRMVTLFTGLASEAGLAKRQVKPRSIEASNGKPPAAKKRSVTVGEVAEVFATAQQQYIDFLIKKADEQEDPNPELLDRIERILGFTRSGETSQ